jgi:hypothetical protein
LHQVIPASRLGRKSGLKFHQVFRVIFHHTSEYCLLRSVASIEYPGASICSCILAFPGGREVGAKRMRTAQQICDFASPATRAPFNHRAI